MTDPTPRRRRIPVWVYAVLAVGSLLVMGTVTIAPAFSCGGISVPPPEREIAQTAPTAETVARQP